MVYTDRKIDGLAAQNFKAPASQSKEARKYGVGEGILIFSAATLLAGKMLTDAMLTSRKRGGRGSDESGKTEGEERATGKTRGKAKADPHRGRLANMDMTPEEAAAIQDRVRGNDTDAPDISLGTSRRQPHRRGDIETPHTRRRPGGNSEDNKE